MRMLPIVCWTAVFVLAPFTAAMPLASQAQAGASVDTSPRHRSFAEMVRFFDYSSAAELDVREISVERRDGVAIHDITYASPKGGVVPAYVIEPLNDDGAARPAILWGHWMMDGSPLKNRREFLQEAILLARSGAVSLLIDAPQVRPAWNGDDKWLTGGIHRASQQQVIDFRRGIHLLIAQFHVDPNRIAYVGHSFDAHVGAILLGVDKRIRVAVLMAGEFADEEYIFDPDIAEMTKLRKEVGEDRWRKHFAEYDWDDPVHYLPHSSPAYVFLQFGKKDENLNGKRAEHYFARFGKPKKIAFYDAGHALNTAARRDRLRFLAARLRMRKPATAAIDAIPQLQ